MYVTLISNMFLPSFQSGLLPTGHVHKEGLSLVLKSVKRQVREISHIFIKKSKFNPWIFYQDSGIYVCMASNGVGRPAEAKIHVHVKCECGGYSLFLYVRK